MEPTVPPTHVRIRDLGALLALNLDDDGHECAARVLFRNSYADVPKAWVDQGDGGTTWTRTGTED